MTSDRLIMEDDLHAFVDHKLDPVRHAEVARYLKNHPEVASRITEYGQQRDALRAALAHVVEEPLPAQLNIRHLIAARERPRRIPWRAIAASFVMLLAGTAGGWTLHGAKIQADSRGVVALAQEAADTYNVFGADLTHPVEFGAEDKSQLVSWISNRLGLSLAVPDLSNAGYRFMGGRLVATPHGPAGLLMYDDTNGHRLAMLVRPMAIDADTRMSEYSFGTLNGYAWARKGVGFSLISAAPAEILHPVANEIRRQEANRV